MTATLDDVTNKKPEAPAEAETAKELARLAREQGLSLTGPDGLLKQLTRQPKLTRTWTCGSHDEHGGDVRASRNGPAAVTSVTTLPGRRPEAPTSAIVSSAVRFCCKLKEFEKVSKGRLEDSSRGFFPRVVKSPAACSSAAKTGEMPPASVPERGLDPAGTVS